MDCIQGDCMVDLDFHQKLENLTEYFGKCSNINERFWEGGDREGGDRFGNDTFLGGEGADGEGGEWFGN